MANYFETKGDFDNWIEQHFSPQTVEEMLTCRVSDEDIIAKLLADGYTDLDNLVLDGHAYMIGSHTNNGWLYEDEADINYLKFIGKKVELRARKQISIKEARLAAGLSRPQMSKALYDIPVRNIEDWESGKHKPPAWAEKLIIKELERIAAEKKYIDENEI